jgi:phosphatidylinositol alpha-1,6-mannosyltransferase
MTLPNATTLGLFPSFERIGGVETSGRIGWEPFARDLGRHQLFCYGAGAGLGNTQAKRHVYHSASKVQAVLNAAILNAVEGRRTPGIVLVWHIGLLKLLPFMRLEHAKVALFLHGVEAWKSQGLWTRHLLRRVDLFLSNSEHTWRGFASFNPGLEEAVHRVVHLGIGEPRNAPSPLPNDPPAVLMLGRLLVGERYKGHHEMVAAWPRVLARRPNAQLWIAGPGALGNELQRKVAEEGLEHSVRIYGQISEDEKRDLLSRCRCLSLPSRGEGFGLVYLEAMRVGRPCLVSNVDAGREVLNPPEAGLAVNPDDPEAIAEATCRLLTAGPEWDRFSGQARLRYEANFTAGHFQDRLVAALAELNP